MKSQYDGIAYPFHKLKKDESVLTAYKDLAEIPIFHVTEGLPQEVDNEWVMRYLILMYSNGSPAIEKFHHIGKRQSWVVQELGISPDENRRFPLGVEQILTNKNNLVLQKKAAFLMLQSPSSWQIWMNASEQLYHLLQTQPPTENKEATERVKLINELNAQITEHRDIVTKFTAGILVEEAVTKFMAYQTLGLRPEEIVMQDLKSVPPHLAKADTLFPEVDN